MAETATLYLESTAIACYEAKEELGANVASIFGANKRSARFYARYLDFAQRSELASVFLKDEVIKFVTEALQYENTELEKRIPLSTVWLCVAIIPYLANEENTAGFEEFEDVLLGRLESLTDEEKKFIRVHKEETDFFLEYFGRTLRTRNDECAEIIIGNIKRWILQESHVSTPIKLKESSASPRLVDSSEYHRMAEIISEMHKEIKECNKEIEESNKKFYHYKKQRKETRKTAHGKTCDECEKEVLETIEQFLEENRVEEIIELIKWRQEEIKKFDIYLNEPVDLIATHDILQKHQTHIASENTRIPKDLTHIRGVSNREESPPRMITLVERAADTKPKVKRVRSATKLAANLNCIEEEISN